MKDYYIHSNYTPRLNNCDWDDTSISIEMMATYQKEVYELALKTATEQSSKNILDIGCGSGLKLVKYFPEPQFKTIGTELPHTLEYLKTTYPDREWIDSTILSTPPKADLVVCADMIEHLPDPDILLEYIQKTASQWIIISTPDADKMGSPNGPPTNSCHVREWNRSQFTEYISSFFTVIDNLVLNDSETTQAIICRLIT